MTIEDPPWKKKTRPCPFYSQGRCLFADGCNFMHTVKIRRPDSVMGSEDSDQPDFRIVVDSPTRPKSVRFRSPTRSPRTRSLLLALGDIIQQEQEEEEWEEGESGEQESSYGEGSSEGRASGDYQSEATPRNLLDGQADHPVGHSDNVSENSARPTPIVGLSEDARRLLHCIPSPPRDESPVLPESSLGDGSTTLVDGISTRPGSLSGDITTIDEDEDFTVTRFHRSATPEHTSSPRRASQSSAASPAQSIIVSEFTASTRASLALDPAPPSRRPTLVRDPHSPSGHTPVVPDSQPPSRRTSLFTDILPPPRRASIHSSRHDSMSSSGLLSPIEISSAPPISFPRYGSFIREDSLDSGYAEGPQPLHMSPPRTPTRRMSTLSILSSPFGSPARVLFGSGVDPRAPSASALISPRFGSFPSSIADDARHSRDGSVDSLQFTNEDTSLTGSQFADADSNAGYDIQVEEPSSVAHHPSSSLTDVPEESSLFQLGSSSDYLAVGDDTFRIGDASFGSDDSMTSLYDQYYTPTVHSTNLENTPGAQEQAGESSSLDLSYLQETSPLTVVGAQMASPEPLAEPEASLSYAVAAEDDASVEQPLEDASKAQPLDDSSLEQPLGDASHEQALDDASHEQALDDASLEQPLGDAFTIEPDGSAPGSAERLDDTHTDTAAARPESVASSFAHVNRVFSPPNASPASVASSGQIRNFSLPSSAHNSLVFAAHSRFASPATPAPDENVAEGSTRSASSLSSHDGERATQRQSVQSASSSQSGSRKVPFGFRHSVTDRSQLVARRPESLKLGRPRPPPLVAVDKMEDELPSRASTPLSPVEETPLTGSPSTSNPRRLKPLRLSMILNSSSSSLGSSIPPSSIPSLTTATTATSAFTPSSPTVSSEYSLSNNRLVSTVKHYTFAYTQYHWIFTT
ncbi:hypothetical protein L226DRAFT_177053 [Lentinus tigrinus ALCF2SS1-7]|uniref:uncharacterized protein n=1 Tax=Lentinus tigrinus ALCF2SS1-7 TaxID=1328758 RepID=UPI0011662548|nr:hypothetical protein L226DRAFT_177053 [Lentinus tigrinus ALCF2SS1-7]